MKRTLFLGLAVAMLCGAPAHANLLTNGSFETGNFNGWTTSNLGTTAVVTGPNGPFYGAVDGHWYVVSGTTGSTPALFSQSFTDTPGALLLITGWAGSGSARPQQYSMAFDGITHITSINDNTTGHLILFGLIEPATGLDSVSIAFLGATDYLAFDNFSVTYYHPYVPEPLSLSLLGAGLAGFGALRRLRRRL